MIVLTGAAGFIGSNFISKLNNEGIANIAIVDDFSNSKKTNNYKNKQYQCEVHRDDLMEWLKKQEKIDFVFHIGARTDTTEFDKKVFDRLNLNYSKNLWNFCTQNNVPFIYASSAATYGDGSLGYDDNHDIVASLKPLNPYGESKNDFDKWVLSQKETPPFWSGLKFFNVYGPNEYHKGRMASVIFHAYNQIKETGRMKLFKSHNPKYKDGEQLRDFIYIKDVVEVIWFLSNNQNNSGLYNLGTGQARTFNDLVLSTFNALYIEPDIEYIDTPIDIRDKYQYFTEAKMNKLRNEGYSWEFYSLEEGVKDYVSNYLSVGNYI